MHSKQIEALIKANNKAMTKLTAAPLESKVPATMATMTANLERAKIWAKKLWNATRCYHCNKNHPNNIHNQCWDLDANTAKRPTGWKSMKST
jgi:hypothetical protein